MDKSPDVFAFEINRTIQAALGSDAYPLRMRDVIEQFAPIHAPDVNVEIEYRPLGSIEGALVASSDKKNFVILVNEDIGSRGRANFTLAHEFGHLLLHRRVRAEFMCGPRDVLGFTEDNMETEANRFASQLLLPNNFVRAESNKRDLSLGHIRALAAATGSSLTAAALAVVAMSASPLGFAVVRDGFVKWGRASETAYKQGLFFKGGTAVPAGSITDFEGGDIDVTFDERPGVEGWSGERWKEQGFYSVRYQESYLLLTQ